jgi:glycosyltransferase involved in cell wall biosynthesis
MKIAQIHDYPPFTEGPIEKNVLSIGKMLIKKDHSIVIGTGRASSELFTETTRQGSQTLAGGLEVSYLDSYDQLKSVIDNVDIVDINMTFSLRPASMIGLEYAVKSRKPTIVNLRTNLAYIPFSGLNKLPLLEQDYKIKKFTEYISSSNVHVVGYSNSIKATLEALGVFKDVEVIRLGMPDEVVYTLPRIHDGTIEKVDLTYNNYLAPLKGVRYLIEAIAIVKKEMPNIKVRIIGEGPDGENLRQYVKHFDLEENIVFAGRVPADRIPMYLAATKLFVFPSLTETWGETVAEALAYGVPVIATGVEGITELTNYGEFAELVQPADSQELAKVIKKTLQDKETYEQLVEKAFKGKEYILANYTLENQAKSLEELYRRVLRG